MAHKKRSSYNFFRERIRNILFIENILKKFLVKNRVREAEKIMLLANQYPTEKKEIINDYKYSIKFTNRSIFQVLNIESVLRYLNENSISGSLVEAGTFTGGCSAYILKAHMRIEKSQFKEFWGFDSFEGMPAPTLNDGDQSSIWLTGKKMNDLDNDYLGKLVGHSMNKANYKKCLNYLEKTGYPLDKINLIKGWFQDTLKVNKHLIKKIALLRLDGDFYESTMVTLEELYPLVSKGGVIIVDDYGGFQGCKKAVDEYFEKINYHPPLIYVENSIRYFIKQKD